MYFLLYTKCTYLLQTQCLYVWPFYEMWPPISNYGYSEYSAQSVHRLQEQTYQELVSYSGNITKFFFCLFAEREFSFLLINRVKTFVFYSHLQFQCLSISVSCFSFFYLMNFNYLLHFGWIRQRSKNWSSKTELLLLYRTNENCP